ncbi:MAG: hypothetical protein V4675_16945 [Verrucomicrobiota bacterium]
MSDSETKLTLQAEKLIREFILKCVTLPAVALSVLAFFLGFYLNTAAKNEAYTDAYKSASSYILNMTAEVSTARAVAFDAREKAIKNSEETEKVLTVVKKLKAEFEELADSDKLTQKLSDKLSSDTTFKDDLMAQTELRLAELQKGTTRLDELEKNMLMSKVFDSQPNHIRALTLLSKWNEQPPLDKVYMEATVADPISPNITWFISGDNIVVGEDSNADWLLDKTTIFAGPGKVSAPYSIQVMRINSKKVAVYVEEKSGRKYCLFDNNGDGVADAQRVDSAEKESAENQSR